MSDLRKATRLGKSLSVSWHNSLNSTVVSCLALAVGRRSLEVVAYFRSKARALAEEIKMRSPCLLPGIVGWFRFVHCWSFGKKSFQKPIIVPSQITVWGSRPQSGHRYVCCGSISIYCQFYHYLLLPKVAIMCLQLPIGD